MYKVIDAKQTPNLQWTRDERIFSTIDEAWDYLKECVKVYESTCLEYGI